VSYEELKIFATKISISLEKSMAVDGVACIYIGYVS